MNHRRRLVHSWRVQLITTWPPAMLGIRTTPALAEAVRAVSALRGSPLGWRRAVLGTQNRLPFAVHVGAVVRTFGFRRFIVRCAWCLRRRRTGTRCLSWCLG